MVETSGRLFGISLNLLRSYARLKSEHLASLCSQRYGSHAPWPQAHTSMQIKYMSCGMTYCHIVLIFTCRFDNLQYTCA